VRESERERERGREREKEGERDSEREMRKALVHIGAVLVVGAVCLRLREFTLSFAAVDRIWHI